MKKMPSLLLATVAAAVLLGSPSRPAPAAHPNILLILTDDMGYGDPSCYGNEEVKTPNIDRLARDGLRLSQFYVASPICSPSRVAVATGMYPARWRINDYLHERAANRRSEQVDWLDPQAPTLARTLKKAGYAAGHFGKWHMGGGRDVQDAPLPSAYGFDEHFVNCEGMGPRIPGFGVPGPEQVEGRPLPRHRFTEFYVDKAIDFIRRHRDRPFYVNLWPMDVHDPHTPNPEAFGRYAGVPKGHRNFDAVLDQYDRQIGRLLDFLRDSGLERDTIVVFTSDNGPNPSFRHQRSGGLRGQKWSLYEGGIREPFILRWPGKVPAGKVDATTVMGSVDLFPTLCRLAGVALPPGVAWDGEDASPAMLGRGYTRSKPLFWEYGRYAHYLRPRDPADVSPNVAIRDGRWKLLIQADGSRRELYDVVADPKETCDLSQRDGEIAASLGARALAWRRSLPTLTSVDPAAGHPKDRDP